MSANRILRKSRQAIKSLFKCPLTVRRIKRSSEYPREFKILRNRVIKKECESCFRGKNLHLHHKNRDKFDNRIGNLMTLCKDCHEKEHGRKFPSFWNTYD
jgi:hypothetical protein